jgi:putative DNA primase/helicase
MTMSAAGIARRLGGRRQGDNWRCACPLNCGYCLVLSDREGGGLLLHCFGGCTFNEVMLTLVEYGLLDGDDVDDSRVSRPAIARQRDDPTRIAQAREIYASGVSDERIAVYLRARGIGLTSPVLRFSECAPHRLGARLPAMLAAIVGVDGEQTGTHLTYLRRDATSKADLPKEFQRECRGVIRGGAIRLAEHDPGVELILCEGVETGLAASQIFDLPCWSAIYAGGLIRVDLPPDVRRIIIAADNDVSGAGQRNALAAYDRWVAEGREVRIKCPPDAGDDFNDVLIKRRANARP